MLSRIFVAFILVLISLQSSAAGMSQVKYDGVMGPIDFTKGPAGNCAEGELFQIRQGKIVVTAQNQ